jgi:large repetitive protein
MATEQGTSGLGARFTAIQCASARARGTVWAAAIALLALAAPAAADVLHYYDELGRLIESVAPDGSVVQYKYDAAGNVTAISRPGTNAIAVLDFTPNSGVPATPVMIVGTGFTSPPTTNTVRFNGTVATVTGGSATTLSVTVPAAATTGPIAVTNSAQASATSVSAFMVGASQAPVVTSFTPNIGSHGSTVTIAGQNFQIPAAADKANFGGVGGMVVTNAESPTPTSLQATLPPGMPSGKVGVGTRYGSAKSDDDFYAIPSGVNPADVDFTGRVEVNSATGATGTFSGPGKTGVVLFDSTVGVSGMYVLTSGVSTSGATLAVYRFDGAVIGSGIVVEGGLIGIPDSCSGTCTIVSSSGSTAGGSTTFKVGAFDLKISDLSLGTPTANADRTWSIPVSYKVTNVGNSAVALPTWHDIGVTTRTDFGSRPRAIRG